MKTILKNIRKPTDLEKRLNKAEIVFIRQGSDGRRYTIYGAKCCESWEQWGQSEKILCDNVADIEAWRIGELLP